MSNLRKKYEVNEITTERMYEVVLAPVVTEKSTMLSENNQVAFYVRKDASKGEIKLAVEKLFKVKVEDVNTVTTKGKVKRFRGTTGKQSDAKKAIISLKEGSNIDLAAGVK